MGLVEGHFNLQLSSYLHCRVAMTIYLKKVETYLFFFDDIPEKVGAYLFFARIFISVIFFAYRTNYSRMDQVKFVEDSLKKN